MYKIDLFQCKSEFNYVFNVNHGNQRSRLFFICFEKIQISEGAVSTQFGDFNLYA
jgi:hypothetical protein